ncbi:MAG: DAK2 domain-containing protein [Clostridia bacterium]|nr:DAK2 domain-containing protein [Clostridia bacterium]
MNNTKTEFILTGEYFVKMIHGAALNLRSEAQKINDLNVFPVPDGDTGDNMLSTLMGGVERARSSGEGLGVTARRVADGMLLSARGNSGVILSQFFDGIAAGFEGLETADAKDIGRAFRKGVRRAYRAVMKPAEGTILTVASDATEYACNKKTGSVEDFLGNFVREARRSLDRTPELLPVLKSAGVVDSGGAGLLSIIEGMCGVFDESFNIETFDNTVIGNSTANKIDFDLFSEDDILEYGYCTELLVRLQSSKTDISTFDEDILKDALTEIGDSIAIVKSGSILKIHVHTKTPDRVLALCQKHGEFLKVKIENMSLQHNSIETETVREAEAVMAEQTRKAFGVVVAACGDGIKQTFLECGADFIVEGGQSMNPSAEDFIRAFEAVNAATIFVFPNNGNVILAARQAAKMFAASDIRVIPSRNVGEGYASLSMIDTSSGDADAIEAELCANMQGVVTAEIARCIRDAEMQNVAIHTGDYIGYVGKNILSASNDRLEASLKLIDSLGLDSHGLFLLFSGIDSTEDETAQICDYIAEHYPDCEVYPIYGGQEIYSYIMVAE